MLPYYDVDSRPHIQHANPLLSGCYKLLRHTHTQVIDID